METKAKDLESPVQASAKTMEPEIKAEEPKSPHKTATDDVPDPDEDDLDDLDDMLDEFSPAKPEVKEVLANSGPGRPTSSKAVEEDAELEGLSDVEFAKQLQAGMADLLGGLETSPEMQAQFASMMRELGGAGAFDDIAGTGAPGAKSKSVPVASPSKGESLAAGEESFQETIKKTMERMHASGESATAAATADDTDDILAELMKQMEAGGLDGQTSEEDFSKMLLGMMEQLTNKEILYEPMKELNDKFPSWMEKNRSTVSKDDLARYKEQQAIVSEIVAKFEEKKYSDSNVADREYIVERMQKMQAAGSPPPDLVGDMAAAQEAFGAPEEGCPQQ